MRAVITNRRFFVAVFFSLCCVFFAQAEDVYVSYYALENAVFEQVLTEEEVDVLYLALLPKLWVIEPEEKRYFFLARAEFFRGIACGREFMLEYDRAVLASDSKKPPKMKIPDDLKIRMKGYFDRALDFCERSISVNPTADGYLGKSMLVLANGGLEGGFSAFVAIFKFLDFSKLAVKTDPDNFEAALMQAVTRAFPPPPFGNPEKGIDEIFALIRKTSPETPKMDLFICYFSLASAYANLEQKENALFWLRQAQSVYPQSTMLRPFEKKISEIK